MKQNPLEFSPAGLAHLLTALSGAGYRTATFGEVSAGEVPREKTVLLRHDVDVCMDFAREMAWIEKAQGVRATYFLMLQSPLYNLFSRHSMGALQEICDLGHEIALHFDAEFAVREGKDITQQLQFELRTLGSLVNAPIRAFSFHQPTDDAIALCLAPEGVINTYHPQHMAGFEYLSDSNRGWRKDPLETINGKHDGLQILLHPIWWMSEGPTTEDCWDLAIKRNFESVQEQILETERAYGPARELAVRRAGSGKVTEVGLSETEHVTTRVMDPESLSVWIDRAIQLEQDSGLTPWSRENFLLDLPDKWKLSKWVYCGNSEAPVGYAVISRKSSFSAHIHRFVIGDTGVGVGTAALRNVIESLEGSVFFLTLFTETNSFRVQNFYENNNFKKVLSVGDNFLYIYSF
ncbi:hypothetical protein [Pelagibius sp.]|uniref:hypothetical protein n=1 Tax=Pelagibius sp. TaxID=1931238 RepID=UPI003BB151D2